MVTFGRVQASHFTKSVVSKEFNPSQMTQSQIRIALLSNDCQLTYLSATTYEQNITKQTLSGWQKDQETQTQIFENCKH